MNEINTERDNTLAIVYRELNQVEQTLGSAWSTMLALDWTTAAGELNDALATVRDLIHDLQAYGGPTGGE